MIMHEVCVAHAQKLHPIEILKYWDPASMDESPSSDKYTDLLHRIFPPATSVSRAFYAAAIEAAPYYRRQKARNLKEPVYSL